MAQDDIFDRKARRRAFHGAASAAEADRWLLARMADEMLFRLGAVKRDFASVLLLGPYAPMLAALLGKQGMTGLIACIRPESAIWPVILCDEDRLAVKDHCFDLVIAAGGLDTVNDLPGALILIRRILTPGGLFMGSMAGAGSLAALKHLLSSDDPVLRAHPQIDVRAAGDLLSRAGFALPVADLDLVDARYARLDRLFADIRANALGNSLAMRKSLVRADITRIGSAFDAAKDSDGRFTEQFGLIYLTGWAPDP